MENKWILLLIVDRRFPDKAIDLIDEACASTRMQIDNQKAANAAGRQRKKAVGDEVDAQERDDQALGDANQGRSGCGLDHLHRDHGRQEGAEIWGDKEAAAATVRLRRRRSGGGCSRGKEVEGG